MEQLLLWILLAAGSWREVVRSLDEWEKRVESHRRTRKGREEQEGPSGEENLLGNKKGKNKRKIKRGLTNYCELEERPAEVGFSHVS